MDTCGGGEAVLGRRGRVLQKTGSKGAARGPRPSQCRLGTDLPGMSRGNPGSGFPALGRWTLIRPPTEDRQQGCGEGPAAESVTYFVFYLVVYFDNLTLSTWIEWRTGVSI